MSEQRLESYKCPSCSAPLRYDPSGKLVCDSCGNSYEPDVIEMMDSYDRAEKPFDWGDYKRKFENSAERLTDSVVYVCRSCGATVETDATTAATHCPYCDNEIVITDRLDGGLKPDGVAPFRIDKNAAIEAVKNHFKGKKLLPGNFKEQHTLDKIRGIYVPFWLFDSGMDGRMVMDATKVRMWSDSNYDYTETSHYLLGVDGSMNFDGVPVDGSSKMDDDLMDALEPFDYSDIRPFDPVYLSGFLADRFDDDPDQSLPRAETRMKNSAEAAIRAEAGDEFTTVTVRNSLMRLIDPTVKYVMLPVYLLNVRYGDKNYRFAVNGQTGKTVGELPISKLKKWLYFGGWTAVAGALAGFIVHWILK